MAFLFTTLLNAVELNKYSNQLLELKLDSYKVKHKKYKKKSGNFYINLKNVRENKVRKILKALFKCDFPSQKPEWCKNLKGNKLELDCVNYQVGLVVEVNGGQHSSYNRFMHKSYKDYEDQCKNDLIKKQLCEAKGLKFVSISHRIPDIKLEEALLYEIGKVI